MEEEPAREHGAICRLGVLYDGSFFSYLQYYYSTSGLGLLGFPELHHFLEKYIGLREQGFASYKVVYAGWYRDAIQEGVSDCRCANLVGLPSPNTPASFWYW